MIRLGTSASVPGGLRAVTLPANVPSATAAAIEALQRHVSAGAAPRQVIIVQSRASKALHDARGRTRRRERRADPVRAVRRASRTPRSPCSGACMTPRSTSSTRPRSEPRRWNCCAASATSARSRPPRRPAKARDRSPTPSRSRASPTARFGWGVKEPGHGLVFANAARPLDAPRGGAAVGDRRLRAAAAARQRPPASRRRCRATCRDIQPAYTSQPAYQPVRGVYNHGWLIGDEAAISAVTQAEIDSLLEISPSTAERRRSVPRPAARRMAAARRSDRKAKLSEAEDPDSARAQASAQRGHASRTCAS